MKIVKYLVLFVAFLFAQSASANVFVDISPKTAYTDGVHIKCNETATFDVRAYVTPSDPNFSGDTLDGFVKITPLGYGSEGNSLVTVWPMSAVESVRIVPSSRVSVIASEEKVVGNMKKFKYAFEFVPNPLKVYEGKILAFRVQVKPNCRGDKIKIDFHQAKGYFRTTDGQISSTLLNYDRSHTSASRAVIVDDAHAATLTEQNLGLGLGGSLQPIGVRSDITMTNSGASSETESGSDLSGRLTDGIYDAPTIEVMTPTIISEDDADEGVPSSARADAENTSGNPSALNNETQRKQDEESLSTSQSEIEKSAAMIFANYLPWILLVFALLAVAYLLAKRR